LILRPKNWASFQHYKDRAPPWIKLHKTLLDDFEFQSLPVASKALAPMLWLLASDHPDGDFDATPAKLAFRLRTTTEAITEALSPCVDGGFFIVVQGDSAVLAKVVRDAIPETEERQRERQRKPAEPDGSSPSGPVWGDALQALMVNGMPEREARTKLGLLLSQWEEAEIVSAFASAVGKSEPFAFAKAILEKRPKKPKLPAAANRVLAELRSRYGQSVVPRKDGTGFWDPATSRAWDINGERRAAA
jgi:hypothetical protein